MSFRIRGDIVERALLPFLVSLSDSAKVGTGDNLKQFGRNSVNLNPDAVGRRHQASTRVVVLERLSLVTLSVSWSDPTLGHFTGQVWRKGIADVEAFCALSRMPICPGDAVFRPRSYEVYVPAYADQMILESAVNLVRSKF